MDLSLLKPNVSSFGYGLTLAISATTIWGGTFPLLPLEVQTIEFLTIFFIIQSIAFVGTFAAVLVRSYWLAHLSRWVSITQCVVAMLTGSLCLIAPLYLPGYTGTFVVASALLLGMGGAGLLILWQRIFTAQDSDRANLNLIVGTGYSALIYAILHLIPLAVAALMIAFIFVPLNGLCLSLSMRYTNYEQAVCSNTPHNTPQAHSQILGNRWRAPLCVGCFGFVSGLVRALAVSDPSMGLVVNLASMAGSLISALVLVSLWQRYSFMFDPVLAFRSVFPFAVTLLIPLCAAEDVYTKICAGIMYMIFMFASMIMMIQCAQTSRNWGIDPDFVYGFYGILVYALQSTGFLFGYLGVSPSGPTKLDLVGAALVSTWILALVFYLVRGHLNTEVVDPESFIEAGAIEFIALKPPQEKLSHDGSSKYQDRLSKQCAALASRYRLSAREAEVVELIIRGHSIARIADRLFVSENTIRTHSKRAYVKLGIHKRQDLLILLEELSPSDLPND